jgi:hypothetical protein
MRITGSPIESFDFVPIPGTDLFVNRSQMTIHVKDDSELDVDFDATFDLGEDGRLVLDVLTAKRRPGGPPVTTGSLRKLNLTAVKIHALAMSCWRWDGEKQKHRPVDWTQDDGEDEMAYVVRIYRMCAATGEKPTHRIAVQLHVTESTASQKIWLARKMGLLEPAPPKGRS